MNSPFFDSEPGTDPVYEALRAPDHPNAREGREAFDRLWSIAAPFVAADVPENARAQFQPVFWEVYLAAALQRFGVPLVPREKRGQHIGGPDLLQQEPPVFYEAVAVMPGTGADAVPEPPVGLREIPDNAISLRLASGLFDKTQKYKSYQTTGVVPSNVPCIIAINAGGIPDAHSETGLPRIIRTIFPFGHEVLHFDSTTWRCVDRSFEYRPVLTKHSGSTVPTCFFEQPSTACISAVLYSAVDPFNGPATPGGDFLLVHNPRAANPLPRGHLSVAWEFWITDDRLCGKRVAT